MRRDGREFANRLRLAMQEAKLNQSELAGRVGAGHATVSEWLTKGILPEGSKMVLLPTILRVNGHWLLTGEGPRYSEQVSAKERALLEAGVRLALTGIREAADEIQTEYLMSAGSVADAAAEVERKVSGRRRRRSASS